MTQGLMLLIRHHQAGTVLYVTALAGTALVTCFALIGAGYTLESPVTVLVLAVVAVLAERVSIRLTKGNEVSISALPVLFASVMFGPLAGGTVGAVSMLGDAELVAREVENGLHV